MLLPKPLASQLLLPRLVLPLLLPLHDARRHLRPRTLIKDPVLQPLLLLLVKCRPPPVMGPTCRLPECSFLCQAQRRQSSLPRQPRWIYHDSAQRRRGGRRGPACCSRTQGASRAKERQSQGHCFHRSAPFHPPRGAAAQRVLAAARAYKTRRLAFMHAASVADEQEAAQEEAVRRSHAEAATARAAVAAARTADQKQRAEAEAQRVFAVQRHAEEAAALAAQEAAEEAETTHCAAMLSQAERARAAEEARHAEANAAAKAATKERTRALKPADVIRRIMSAATGDRFKVLGLDPSASKVEQTQALRALALLLLHPDRGARLTPPERKAAAAAFARASSAMDDDVERPSEGAAFDREHAERLRNDATDDRAGRSGAEVAEAAACAVVSERGRPSTPATPVPTAPLPLQHQQPALPLDLCGHGHRHRAALTMATCSRWTRGTRGWRGRRVPQASASGATRAPRHCAAAVIATHRWRRTAAIAVMIVDCMLCTHTHTYTAHTYAAGQPLR